MQGIQAGMREPATTFRTPALDLINRTAGILERHFQGHHQGFETLRQRARAIAHVRAAGAIDRIAMFKLEIRVNVGQGRLEKIELLLTRGKIDVDLHWRLLRDGRLRNEDINGMLERRCNVEGHWMLNADDALFLLLVHPAFAKHLSSWELGLHRVADILRWLQTQQADWKTVRARLEDNDVRTAAWATLRWLQLLTHPNTPSLAISMLEDLEPGNIRRRWLNRWLVHDLSERAAGLHKARLLGFSLTLHDNFKGAWRALAGRYRAHRRRHADLAAFGELPGQ